MCPTKIFRQCSRFSHLKEASLSLPSTHTQDMSCGSLHCYHCRHLSNEETACVGMGEEQTRRTTWEKRERAASCPASEKRKLRVIEYKKREYVTGLAELEDREGLFILQMQRQLKKWGKSYYILRDF